MKKNTPPGDPKASSTSKQQKKPTANRAKSVQKPSSVSPKQAINAPRPSVHPPPNRRTRPAGDQPTKPAKKSGPRPASTRSTGAPGNPTSGPALGKPGGRSPTRRLVNRRPVHQKSGTGTINPDQVSFDFSTDFQNRLASHLGNEQVQLLSADQPTSHELEIRLGSYDRGFQAYVSLLDFSRLYSHYAKNFPDYQRQVTLDMYYDHNYRISLYGETPEISRNEIEYFCQTNHLRRAKFVEKNLVRHENNHDWQYRITSCKDQEISDAQLIESLTKKIQDRTISKYYRYKNRYSFLLHPQLRLDLTVCKESPTTAGSFQNSFTLDQKEKYQVELEYLGTDFSPQTVIDIFNPILEQLLKNYQHTLRPISESHRQLVLSNFLELTTQMKNMPRNLLANKPNYKFTALDPIPLTRQNFSRLRTEPYVATIKADGHHHLLYLDPKLGSFLINNRLQPSPTQLPDKLVTEAAPALFDGELVVSQGKTRFLIFDVFFYQGQDVRDLPLYHLSSESGARLKMDSKTRMYYASEFTKKVPVHILSNDLLVQTKDYYQFADPRFRKVFKEDYNRIDDSQFPYGTDGLILMPATAPYPKVTYDPNKRFFERPAFPKKDYQSLPPILKWKSSSHLSIDFRVKFGAEKKIRQLGGQHYLQVDLESSYGRGHIAPFEPSGYRVKDYHTAYLLLNDAKQPLLIPYQPPDSGVGQDFETLQKLSVPMDDDSVNYLVKNGDILEFVWLPDRRFGDDYWGRWFPIKYREDKTEIGFPNSYYVANMTWLMIHDIQITPKMILGFAPSPELPVAYYQKQDRVDLPHVRKIHNVIKRVLIFLAFYNTSRPQTLLDFATGRAGDLDKWKIGIKYVLGVELDEVNLKTQAFDRYYNLICDYQNRERRNPPLTVDLIQGNMSRALEDPNFSTDPVFTYLLKDQVRRPEQFGIVSCMFALHYICDTEEHIHNFFENVGDQLASGGYFVATTFDGDKVFKALKRNKDGEIEGKKGDQVIWRITRKYPLNETLADFGQKILVYNPTISEEPQVEFLVNFNYLAKVAQKFGLVPNILTYQDQVLPLDGSYGIGSFSEIYTDGFSDLLEKLNLFSSGTRRGLEASLKDIQKDSLEYSQYSSFLILKKN